MPSTQPIFTVSLFPKLDQKLLETLRSLSAADWAKPTIATQWTVKDIAGHLLDGNIRSLSMLRDEYFGAPSPDVESYQGLVSYLNDLNADWIKAMKRVSPKILLELLETTGRQYCDFLQSLDPDAQATFSVFWAGEETSPNWFHIAREYTEKWHHQQQIRLAVGQETVLYQPEFYLPHLQTSMRALPHHYQKIKGEKGALICFQITGPTEARWYLQRLKNKWVLIEANAPSPTCTVVIPGDIAWRIFTKGISQDEAQKRVAISGKTALGEPIFDMLAVMA